MEWERPDTSTLAPAEVMAYIRARCPWAAAHTHTSLQKYLLEETHELIAALDAHAVAATPTTRAEVVAELGDVLYQVLFHAALLDAADGDDDGGEANGDDGVGDSNGAAGDLLPATALHGEPAAPRAIDEVVAGLTAKLIRRHPHVFDSDGPVDLREVERRYEAVKAAERAAAGAAGEQPAHPTPGPGAVPPAGAATSDRAEQARASFASVPVTLPALTRAQSVLGRIDRLELPVPDAPGAQGEAAAIGAELFDLVVRAQAAGIDAEAALRGVTSEVEAAAIRAAAREPREGERP